MSTTTPTATITTTTCRKKNVLQKSVKMSETAALGAGMGTGRSSLEGVFLHRILVTGSGRLT